MTKKRGRIARLYYVRSPRGHNVHLANHITEGYRTLCGVQIWIGWRWARSRTAQGRARAMPICKRCHEKAPSIVVERVRRS